MQYEYVLCLLHEVCLYVEYKPADFKPPYSISMPGTDARDKARTVLTPLHLSSVMRCVSSAHAILDIFVSIPTAMLRCSPVVVYARVGYAVIILLKIHVSAALRRGVLNGVLATEATKIEFYLERVIGKLTGVCAEYCGVAVIWLSLITRLEDWFRHCFILNSGRNESTDIWLVELLRHLKVRKDYIPRTETTRAVATNTLQGEENSPPEHMSVSLHPLPQASVVAAGHSLSASYESPDTPSCVVHPSMGEFSGGVPDDLEGWVGSSPGFLGSMEDFFATTDWYFR